MGEQERQLHELIGFTYKELHECYPERAKELISLIDNRRKEHLCDLCGGPLAATEKKGSTDDKGVVAPHIVGFSKCERCR